MKTILNLIVVLLLVSSLSAQTVTTYSATSVAQTTTTIRGYIDPGAGSFYGVEFEIADNSSFTSSFTKGPDEGTNFSASSNISYNLTGLTPNTTYFVRVNVGYSTVTGGGLSATSKNFTTLAASVPTITIGSDFSNITNNSANNTGNEVTNDGGSSVDACGVVYSKNSTPSTADNVLTVTSGLATFSANITGLDQLTKYYVRAYAHNSTGDGYSSITKSFTTLASTNASIDSMVSYNSGELTIYYKPGSGNACIIYMRENNSISDNPINGTTYSGNTAFGSGDDLGNNTYVICAVSNSKSNSVTVTNLDDNSDYYIKTGSYDNTSNIYDNSANSITTDGNSNLPIELLSFTGHRNKNIVDLKWITATETNNDYFTIERSTNNKDYEIIDKISGAGNSNTYQIYTTTDINIKNNESYYYRLLQTDYDGKFTYSTPIFIGTNNDKLSLTKYTNTSSSINLNISNPDNSGTLQIIDISGRIVYTDNIYTGENLQFKINKDNFKHGIYFVRLVNNKSQIIKKIII